MPKSMTGFGSADGAVAGGRLHLEVKTVNHRHFNCQVRVPATFQPLESELRERLRGRIDRGHVTLAAQWLEEATPEAEVSVDVERAQVYYRALHDLAAGLGLDDRPSLEFVARQPDVLVYRQADMGVPAAEEVLPILDAALGMVDESRRREGEALGRELAARLAEITRLLDEVEASAPERVVRERDRLREAVLELADGVAVDPQRLAQEIAILADRLDIREEMVRLREHLRVAGEAVASEAPVGKQLGFLGQEMLREINTIGSKANDAAIAHAVVAMKGELEKYREQVENLE